MTRESPPVSAVSISTGFVGLAALAAGLMYVAQSNLDLPKKTLICLAAPAVAMALWELFIHKAHLRAGTGLNFSNPRPLEECLRRTFVKLVGLWGTWACIAFVYWGVRTYAHQDYALYIAFLKTLLPILLWLSAIYVLVIDRYSVDPEDDGSWHAGNFFIGRWNKVKDQQLKNHALGWLIKAFFLPYMVSIVPGNVDYMTNSPPSAAFSDAISLVGWSLGALFLVDIVFATIGYVFALKFLDTHIRSPNPYLAGWVAALLCYPPTSIIGGGGPLVYGDGHDWSFWLGGNETLLWLWAAIIIFLTTIFAWATMIFGLRFSNLTHRGIITNGPFRYTKHPAYLTKNLSFWITYLPFLSTENVETAIRNSILLGIINLIYYWRAKTEEKHLMADPVYRQYAEWIDRHGLFAKMRVWRL